MQRDNITRLADAARRRHELTRAKAIRALHELDRAGVAITFDGVARQALLTDLDQEFLQFTGLIVVPAGMVPTRDRR